MAPGPRTPATTILSLRDGREPVAYLVSISDPARTVAIPIPRGRELFGWRRRRDYLPPLDETGDHVESVQWIIETDGVTASVLDAASTDGSFLFRAACPPPPGRLELRRVGALPGAQALLHPSALGGQVPPPTPLHDGDYLVSVWATLRFELAGR